MQLSTDLSPLELGTVGCAFGMKLMVNLRL